ncbi:MAG: Na+/H+ antiporter NhaA, partial [Acidimicrobiia bacterium]
IGAILVIAVFYTGELSWGWLAGAAAGFLVILAMRRGDVQSLAPYLGVGAFAWLCLLESGVHATLAGVALGLMTPAWPLRSPRRFPPAARALIDKVEWLYYDRVLTAEEFAQGEQRIAEVSRLAMYSTSPLERLERALAPWVAYVVVPVFALANAGVALSGESLAGLVEDRTTLGVVLGLALGKPIGITLATLVAVKLGIGRLPAGTSWRHVVGLGTVAGIGFTVALFVTSLSFDDSATTDAAKVGILAASLLAGIVGYLQLRSIGPAPVADERSARAPAAPDVQVVAADPA